MLQYKSQGLKKETLLYYPVISTCLPVHFFRGSDELMNVPGRIIVHFRFPPLEAALARGKKGPSAKVAEGTFRSSCLRKLDPEEINGRVSISPAMYTI